MSKFGFLSILEEELEKALTCDFAMDWDKRNHAVEVVIALEAHNANAIATVDDLGQETTDDIIFEDAILFYNPSKSTFNPDDYLVTIPYLPKKGLSREFLAYFAEQLNLVAENGLSDLMDFLSDSEAEEFSLVWNSEEFEAGKKELNEKIYYPYPRY